MDKTHPLQRKYNKFRNFDNNNHNFILDKIHAEIACLSQICDLDINWQRVDLHIYRIRKSIPYGNARPCVACMQAIKSCGIKTLYYTTDNGFSKEKITSEII